MMESSQFSLQHLQIDYCPRHLDTWEFSVTISIKLSIQSCSLVPRLSNLM